MVTVLGRERDGTAGSQQEIIQVRNISIHLPPLPCKSIYKEM